MARRLAIPSKEIELALVGSVDSYIPARVQRVNLTSDIPSTDVDELGNPLHAGIVQDTPNVTLTFSVLDVSIKTFSVLTGTDPTSYPGAGVDAGTLSEVDAILYVKDATVADYAKSASAKRLQVRDYSFSYSVDGDSTEEYTAIGSEKRWFKNDVVVDKFTAGDTSFTLSETPIQLKNGDYVISAVLDGEYLTEVTDAPDEEGEYQVSGTTLTTNDSRSSQLMVVYHANPAGTNWTNVSDATIPAAIRGRDVKIEIAASDIDRVQSVTINGNLNSEPVREMGNRVIVGYQAQVPSLEGTITVLDTDTELMDLLLNGTATADTEFEFGIGCPDVDVPLEVKLYDPCDTTISGVLLKTVYVPSIIVQGDVYTANVNNNVTATFNWRSEDAQCIVYSGARP